MNKKGFTLVEVMVSFTLISVISIFLFQIIYVVRDIYIEQGKKTELYLDQANISNYINKDLYELTRDNNLAKVEKTNDTTVEITPRNGAKRTLIIEKENNYIEYMGYGVRFLGNTTIGNIEFVDTYEGDTIKPGVLNIFIPITNKDDDTQYNINTVICYNSSTSVVK